VTWEGTFHRPEEVYERRRVRDTFAIAQTFFGAVIIAGSAPMVYQYFN